MQIRQSFKHVCFKQQRICQWKLIVNKIILGFWNDYRKCLCHKQQQNRINFRISIESQTYFKSTVRMSRTNYNLPGLIGEHVNRECEINSIAFHYYQRRYHIGGISPRKLTTTKMVLRAKTHFSAIFFRCTCSSGELKINGSHFLMLCTEYVVAQPDSFTIQCSVFIIKVNRTTAQQPNV